MALTRSDDLMEANDITLVYFCLSSASELRFGQIDYGGWGDSMLRHFIEGLFFLAQITQFWKNQKIFGSN